MKLFLIGLLSGLAIIQIEAQTIDIRGGVKTVSSSTATLREPFSDSLSPPIVSVQDFVGKTGASRLEMLRAWTSRIQKTAAHALGGLSPIVEDALADSDVAIRRQSVAMLYEMVTHRDFAELRILWFQRDAFHYNNLYVNLFASVVDEDPNVRAHAVGSLASFNESPDHYLETVFIERLRLEDVPSVKRQLIRGISKCAAKGSERSRNVLRSALSDPAVGVQLSAIEAIMSTNDVDALPLLVGKLSAPLVVIRLRAIAATRQFEQAARPYIHVFQERIRLETDPRVRGQLEQVLTRIADVKATQ